MINKYNRDFIFSRENTPRSPSSLLKLRRSSKNPSPENLMRVNNKILSLTSIKKSFQNANRSYIAEPPTFEVQKINKLDITNFSIKHYGLNDTQADAYSMAFRSFNRLESLNLRGNRLKSFGAKKIIESLNWDNLKELDLSKNQIGSPGIKSIKNLLENDLCSLEALGLENINLSLEGLKILCGCLKTNQTLKSLNISNNKLSRTAGQELGLMLYANTILETLDIQWNQLNGTEAVCIFKGLSHNTSLKTLDISWNPIGNDKISNTIKALSVLISSNKHLIHLDLSNSNFSMEDCIIFSDCIKSNHVLKGLHFQGNYGRVDSLGYIVTLSYMVPSQPINQTGRIATAKKKIGELCWICDGWSDVYIEWDPATVIWNRRLKHFALDKLSVQDEPVYVHLETEDYSPFLLKKNSEGIYHCTRALPKGKNRFFFTYRGVAQISSQYRIEGLNDKIEKNIHFYGEFSKKIMIVLLNYIDNTTTNLLSLPRIEIPEYNPIPGDTIDPDLFLWSLSHSIFSAYTQDTPSLIESCFEVDWSNSKIPKILKTEIKCFTCKEILKQEYSRL